MGWNVGGILVYLVITAVLRYGFGFDWWIGFPVAAVVYWGASALKKKE